MTSVTVIIIIIRIIHIIIIIIIIIVIIIIIIIIIIIVWLVQRWTLPFLRACSRLGDSALDDRRLPDQWLSGARSDSMVQSQV